MRRARTEAIEALYDYAEALKEWNAPDDEHSRIQLHAMVEEVIGEVLPRGFVA